MRQQYHCPHCKTDLKQTARTLDFFCRACFTTVVVIDDQWAQVMRVSEGLLKTLPVAVCRRPRGTEPLNGTIMTGPLAC